MKAYAKSLVYILFILLLTSANLVIISNTQHRNEVVSSLRHATYEAMDVAFQARSKYYYLPANDWNYTNTVKKMTQEFNRALLSQIESDCNVKVEFIKVDPDNGLLDVKVTEYFTYPTGRTGSTSFRCTMVYNEAEPTPNPLFGSASDPSRVNGAK